MECDPILRPIVVQIGYNKCATTSLYKLFDTSGYKSLHFTGKKYRRQNDPEVASQNPQIRIGTNILKGRPAFEGLDTFSAFFDLQWYNGDQTIENFKSFQIINETYPNAKFILNTRDPMSWVFSRAIHGESRLLNRAKKTGKVAGLQVLNNWLKDYNLHNDEVRSYFTAHPGRLLEYNIDKEPITKVCDFVAPDFHILSSKWAVFNNNARRKEYANVDAELFLAEVFPKIDTSTTIHNEL